MTSLTLKLPTVFPFVSSHVQAFGPPCRYLIRVMLSAGRPGTMRGIERVFAGILLLAAIAGAAAFAHGLGRTVATPAPQVHLASPPPQHASAPGTVVIPLLPGLEPTTAAPQVARHRPAHHGAGVLAPVLSGRVTLPLLPAAPAAPRPVIHTLPARGSGASSGGSGGSGVPVHVPAAPDP